MLILTTQLIIAGYSLEQMPLLTCQFLQSYREQRLAHLVLSFITMGYVWQEGEMRPKKVRGPIDLSSGKPAAPEVFTAWPHTAFLENRSFLVLFFGYQLKEGQMAHLRERIFSPKKLIFFRTCISFHNSPSAPPPWEECLTSCI